MSIQLRKEDKNLDADGTQAARTTNSNVKTPTHTASTMKKESSSSRYWGKVSSTSPQDDTMMVNNTSSEMERDSTEKVASSNVAYRNSLTDISSAPEPNTYGVLARTTSRAPLGIREGGAQE